MTHTAQPYAVQAEPAQTEPAQTETRHFSNLMKTGLLLILVALLTSACSGKASFREQGRRPEGTGISAAKGTHKADSINRTAGISDDIAEATP